MLIIYRIFGQTHTNKNTSMLKLPLSIWSLFYKLFFIKNFLILLSIWYKNPVNWTRVYYALKSHAWCVSNKGACFHLNLDCWPALCKKAPLINTYFFSNVPLAFDMVIVLLLYHIFFFWNLIVLSGGVNFNSYEL